MGKSDFVGRKNLEIYLSHWTTIRLLKKNLISECVHARTWICNVNFIDQKENIYMVLKQNKSQV